MKLLNFAVMTIAITFSLTGTVIADISKMADPDPIFLTESDSGIVFGDLDCKITEATVDPVVTFSEDPFNYLFATVKAHFTCVDRGGVSHHYSGQDTVWFPTVDFDWQTQEWSFAQTAVAERNSPYGIVLKSGIKARVWQYVDENHLALKVELWSE